MGRKNLTDAEKLAILDSYSNGDKMSVIAATHKVNDSTVYRVIRKAEVPIRWYGNIGRRQWLASLTGL